MTGSIEMTTSASVRVSSAELAAAAELLTHKLAARPVVVVRGYEAAAIGERGTAQDLVMDPAKDLFR